jgi:hypothetical protein
VNTQYTQHRCQMRESAEMLVAMSLSRLQRGRGAGGTPGKAPHAVCLGSASKQAQGMHAYRCQVQGQNAVVMQVYGTHSRPWQMAHTTAKWLPYQQAAVSAAATPRYPPRCRCRCVPSQLHTRAPRPRTLLLLLLHAHFLCTADGPISSYSALIIK